ncbi:glutaredoxin domain-containing protein [Streptomyces sp. SudanB182_2057]|uniref:glutaredoxin domain-containing protein n=1 Tax=Streptomyces sp. SudanB182_2057 TaxID=3035281 RepID=UPI003F54BCD4
MMRAWALPLLFIGCGSLVAAVWAVDGSVAPAVAVWPVFALLAVVHSPLVFPRPVGAVEARELGAVDGRPVVYWRAGCKYCLRLRFRLGRDARRLRWVDIWRDPAGAAAVRAVNGGAETVPTVVVAGRPYVNPDPRWVRAQL